MIHRQSMQTRFRGVIGLLLPLTTSGTLACERDGPPHNWPSFPQTVIQAGQGLVVPGKAGGSWMSRTDFPSSVGRPEDVADRLRSDNLDDQRGAILAVRHYEMPDLIPRCIPLLESTDYLVRDGAIEAIVELGIPNLTINNAPKILGFSTKVDRHVAAYCYAKYGRAALPIVRKVAFTLLDSAAPNRPSVSTSPVGMLQILTAEGVDGLEADVIDLVKSVHWHRPVVEHINLLGMVNGQASAHLIGRYLAQDDGYNRFSAIKAAQARRLTQYADDLFEIVKLPLDTEEFRQWRKHGPSKSISLRESDRIRLKYSSRPIWALAAAEALIDFEDPRAWSVAVHVLEDGALTRRRFPGPIRSGEVVYLGKLLAKLKDRHGLDFQAKLREELSGQNRYWIVVALATALSLEPTSDDKEILWSVAKNGDAARAARILCAIALSKLDEVGITPVLRDLAEPDKAFGSVGCLYHQLPPAIKSLRLVRSYRRTDLYGPDRIAMLRWSDLRELQRHALERHHVDLEMAVARLGDTKSSTVSTAILRFEPSDLEGHLEKLIDPSNPQQLSRVDQNRLRYEIPFLIDHGLLGQYAEHLVAAFKQTEHGPGSPYRTTILDALCRSGDKRGLELAADNPLLLLELARYLADAPGPSRPFPGFKYNRVADGMELANWLRDRWGELTWDQATGKFRASSPDS